MSESQASSSEGGFEFTKRIKRWLKAPSFYFYITLNMVSLASACLLFGIKQHPLIRSVFIYLYFSIFTFSIIDHMIRCFDLNSKLPTIFRSTVFLTLIWGIGTLLVLSLFVCFYVLFNNDMVLLAFISLFNIILMHLLAYPATGYLMTSIGEESSANNQIVV
ncbi:hypothetical protein RF11_16007 [Thelohanellus kitauei]|uniref:Uncharacterized protein n=1 Tax=Thelohanellus kitauei TaxID=669202 RepID=A0A0C2JBI2_THEKT|nr:hypothetical protein RF11_16007 [Thelohanellus kitauei]